MTKGLILALGFAFLIWLILVLFIWAASKGEYIPIKSGKVPAKYAKFIIVVWTTSFAIAVAMLVLRAIKKAV